MTPRLKYSKINSSGFTLVELLIAITIIAILSALGLTGYQAIYRASRDTKRQADLRLIQSALEDFHADQLYYPDATSFTPGEPLKFGAKKYLNEVPKDPSASQTYLYVPSANSYCLYANMEGTAPLSDSDCTPTSPYDYGVTRP